MGLLVTNKHNIRINQYQDYKTRSNDNRIKVVPIVPNRGLILTATVCFWRITVRYST